MNYSSMGARRARYAGLVEKTPKNARRFKKDSPAPPPPPDPTATSAAQYQYNSQAARDTARIDRYNQVGPDGTVTWSQDATNPDIYTQTTALNPTQQQTYNQGQNLALGAATLGNDQISRLSSILGQNFDPTRVQPGIATGVGEYGVQSLGQQQGSAGPTSGKGGATQPGAPNQQAGSGGPGGLKGGGARPQPPSAPGSTPANISPWGGGAQIGGAQDAAQIQQIATQNGSPGGGKLSQGSQMPAPQPQGSGNRMFQMQGSAASPNLQTGIANAGGIQNSIAGAGGIQNSIAPGGQIQAQLPNVGSAQRSFGDAGSIQGNVNNDFSALGQQAQDAILSRVNPQLDRQQTALQTQLANQGIPVGSEAYSRAMNDFGQQRNDATQQAVLGGLQQENNLFNQNVTAGSFANQAQNQNYSQLLGRQAAYNSGLGQDFSQALGAGQFANQAQGQQFGQNQAQQQAQAAAQAQLFGQNATQQQAFNAAQSQLFGQNQTQAQFGNDALSQMFANNQSANAFNNQARGQQFQEGTTNANFQNQAHQQAISDALLQRNQPLNEIGMLMGLGGVQQPNAVQGAQVQFNAPDYQGAVNSNYQGQVANANAARQQQGSTTGAIAGLAGTAMMVL